MKNKPYKQNHLANLKEIVFVDQFKASHKITVIFLKGWMLGQCKGKYNIEWGLYFKQAGSLVYMEQ